MIALCSSPVAYWIPSHLGSYLPVSYLFAFSYYLWGSSHNKNNGVVCHFLLWQARGGNFCQNSSLWPVYLGYPCMTWPIASLSYASPFTMTRLWSMKISVYFIYIILYVTIYIIYIVKTTWLKPTNWSIDDTNTWNRLNKPHYVQRMGYFVAENGMKNIWTYYYKVISGINC